MTDDFIFDATDLGPIEFDPSDPPTLSDLVPEPDGLHFIGDPSDPYGEYDDDDECFDEEPIDLEVGFDPYEGDYTWDC